MLEFLELSVFSYSVAPTRGSGNVIGLVIEKDAEAEFTHRGGVQMIGRVSKGGSANIFDDLYTNNDLIFTVLDVQMHAISTVAG